MAETRMNSAKDLADLRAMVNSLELENSRLRGQAGALNDLLTGSGLRSTLDGLLNGIVSATAAKEATLYFRNGDVWFRRDNKGTARKLTVLDDELVAKAFDSRVAVELKHGHVRSSALPLTTESEVIGAVKLEGSLPGIQDLSHDLSPFLTLVARMLKKASVGRSRLEHRGRSGVQERKTADCGTMKEHNGEQRRRSAMDELHESEARFLSTFRSSPIAMSVWSKQDLTVLDVNESYLAVTGLTRKKLLGHPRGEMSIWADREKEQEFLRLVQEGGRLHNYEFKFRRPRGEEGYGLVSATGILVGGEECILTQTIDITTSKQAVLALEDEVRRRRVLFEQNMDGIFTLSDDHRIVDANQSFCSILGYSREEILQMRPWEWDANITSREAFDELVTLLAAQTGQPHNFETQIRRKDGTIRLLDVRIILGRFRSNREAHCICRDITDLRKAEEDQRRMNRELRAISNCNQTLIRAMDEEALVKEICRIICDETGYRMAWVGYAGKGGDGNIVPVASAGEATGFLEAAGFGRPEQMQVDGLTVRAIRTGKTVYVQDIAAEVPARTEALQFGFRSALALPLRDEQGATFGNLTVYSAEPSAFIPGELRLMEELASDLAFGISTLRSRNQRLETEERLRTLVETIPDCVMRFDTDIRVLFINSAVTRLLGLRIEDMVGKKLMGLSGLGHPEQIERLHASVSRVVETGVPGSIEILLTTKSGDRSFEVVHMPERDKSGATISIVSLLHDVTELKKAEQERLSHLRFVECLDVVNRAMQGTSDIEQMMANVLDTIVGIFGCDRAWLTFPCDPDAPAWKTSMVRAGPDYPWDPSMRMERPIKASVAEVFRTLRNAQGPVQFHPFATNHVPKDAEEEFRLQSFLAAAIYPKIGEPWAFGVDQSSFPRIWSGNEEKLLQEIGRRLGDSLTSLLAYRDVQESGKRYREIFENSSDVIELCEESEDGRLRLLDANPAWEKLLEFPRDKVVGKFLDDVAMGDYRQMAIEDFNQCKTSRGPIDFERALVTDKGHFREVHTTVLPISNDAGRFYRFVRIGRDITERKAAEAELRKLSRVVEQSPVAVIITTRSGAIEYVNPRFTQTTGYTAEEVRGKTPRILKSGETPAEVYKQLWETITRGEEWHGEFHNKKKNGELYWEAASIYPVHSEQGQISFFVAIKEDITERKQADLALRASLQEKDTLLKEIHHRVKNNLQVISSLLSLQATDVGDSVLNAAFKESQNRVRSMALVHEQLYQSQSLAAIDFGKYLEHVSSSLISSYGKHTVACEIVVRNVWLDIDRAIPCGLIVNELVTNALKHAFRDRQTGRIGLRMEKDGSEIVLIVEDDGAGIPVGVDFFSAKSMGSTIVRTLVDQLGGTVRLEGGGGARFIIRFPAPREDKHSDSGGATSIGQVR